MNDKKYEESLKRAKESYRDYKEAFAKCEDKESKAALMLTGSISALEFQYPELTESEDERIRKELIEYLTHRAEVTGFINENKDCKRWIAYLEKERVLSELGKYIAAERIKPGFMFNGNDSASWEELPLDVRKHDYPYYFIGDLDCYPFDVEKQKEQKPVEIHIDNPNIQKFDPDVEVITSDSSIDRKELRYISSKCYDTGFRDGVASVKPVEWSENDKRILNEAIGMIGAKGCWVRSDDAVKQVSDFLKSLRSRPKSSDNWKPSKEQMEALNRCILIGNEDMIYALNSLCDDLKKLL